MVEEIPPDDLWSYIQRGDPIQVIDIRTEDEFTAGHIPGAENIPFHQFARGVSEHEWTDVIVLACPKGESSRQAARLLESYEEIDDTTRIINLEGGYSAWPYELESPA